MCRERERERGGEREKERQTDLEDNNTSLYVSMVAFPISSMQAPSLTTVISTPLGTVTSIKSVTESHHPNTLICVCACVCEWCVEGVCRKVCLQLYHTDVSIFTVGL